MPMNPPSKFLLEVSETSLRMFEVQHLNNAANVRKELRVLLDALVEEESQSLLARWLIENRNELILMGTRPATTAKEPPFDFVSSRFGKIPTMRQLNPGRQVKPKQKERAKKAARRR